MFEHLRIFLCCVPEKGEENKDGADGDAASSDESDNFSDISDDEVNNFLLSCVSYITCEVVECSTSDISQ